MAKSLRTFRLDDDEWSAFRKLCDSRGESASEAIRRLILVELKGPYFGEKAANAPKSAKSAPKTPKTTPKPADDSPKEPEINYSERFSRFSKAAQASRGKRK